MAEDAALAGLAVRPAELADAAQIARVHVASWRAAYAGMVPEEILAGLSVDGRTQMWRDSLGADKDPREAAYVAVVSSDARDARDVSDDRVVGFSFAGPTTDADANAAADHAAAADPESTALLHALYLDESAWGRGVGSALLDATMTALKENNFSVVTLWVITANERARVFYEARGWRPDGHSQECFGMDVRVDVPTLRYRRSLA